MNGIPTAGVAYQPQATSIAFTEPPLSPPPEPVQAVQAPIPTPAPQDESVAVFIHLSSGERIWAGRFDTGVLAEQRAHGIVRAINRPEPGVWAKFGNRLVRPDAVVSIELAPRRED